MLARVARLVFLAGASGLGWAAGWIGRTALNVQLQPVDFPSFAQRTPLPHHVPPHAGGTSFRFAMAHDVLHERYPKHGPAYYRERERLTLLKLENAIADSPEWFALNDDLAAALDRLNREDEAIEVMRRKLARQRLRGMSESELYTSYANLGTFLMHSSFSTMNRDPEAKERFREGLGYVEKGLAVNPNAHFNRERWEVAFGKYLLETSERPAVLKEADCLGNRFDYSIKTMLDPYLNWAYSQYGRPYDMDFGQSRGQAKHEVPAFFAPDVKPDDPGQWDKLNPIRKHIAKIGGDAKGEKGTIPFDEPMLGIVGLWRQGTGANAHLAIAMGETMLRVGQRYIAWTAFERADRLIPQLALDPEVRSLLGNHCRKRQAEIEETFTNGLRDGETTWMNASGPITQEQMAKLHTNFDSELAYGQAYQRAYREYEETRIAAGASIADEHFYDEFYASREPIASKPGEEEWFVWVPVEKIHEYGDKLSLAWGMFGAGLGAMAMAVIVRLFPGRPKSDLRQQLDSLSSGEPDWLSADRPSSGSQAEKRPGDI